MQRRPGVLFLVAALYWPVSANAACVLQYAGPDGKSYSQSELPKFVAQEVRPKLSKVSGSFKITVEENCNSPISISVTFDATDYYIIDIGNHHLTKEESTYKTSALTLSRETLENEIAQAHKIDTLSLPQIQNLVKTLAFFFAETARFSDIDTIATSLLNNDCSAEWLDYATLLRRWSRISRLAIHEHTDDWTARGGSSDQLIAPVTRKAITGYNAAISAGKDGPNASYVDPSDWDKHISAPTASCKK